jgi:hypothetical protein
MLKGARKVKAAVHILELRKKKATEIFLWHIQRRPTMCPSRVLRSKHLVFHKESRGLKKKKKKERMI